MGRLTGQHRKKISRIFLYAVLALLYHTLFAAEVLTGKPSDQRRAELQNLLLQDCGSCHGMTLKGGLGPALTPEALQDKPREFIERTILEGRSETPMPPWKNILSPDEVRWLVDLMYTGVAP